MAHLLHIDSSPRGVGEVSAKHSRSHSRRMTREFVEAWQHTHPHDTVTYRDVSRQPVPHVDEPWIVAAYTPEEQRTPELREALRVSDRLIDELIAADTLVVGVPMYNFSVPSTFKAYIDQIVRTGRTFAIDPEDAEDPYKPLLHGKKMFVITARGASGFGPGERYGHMNHQDPYLRVAFGFIGITDITFVHVENDEHSSESLAASIAAAQAQVAELVAA